MQVSNNRRKALQSWMLAGGKHIWKEMWPLSSILCHARATVQNKRRYDVLCRRLCVYETILAPTAPCKVDSFEANVISLQYVFHFGSGVQCDLFLSPLPRFKSIWNIYFCFHLLLASDVVAYM